MAKGRPAGLRLETAERGQIEFQQGSLDDLLSLDHRARQVWDYVEGLDLSRLYARVQTTVSSSGRPAIDPAILVSLWLYATLEGVGSARLLDRLCQSDAAYRWLLGGVTVNYHTLSDFRTEAGPVLNRLLSSSMAGLISSGAVRVDTLAVDGMKLQAAANRGTFRRARSIVASPNFRTRSRESSPHPRQTPAAAARRRRRSRRSRSRASRNGRPAWRRRRGDRPTCRASSRRRWSPARR